MERFPEIRSGRAALGAVLVACLIGPAGCGRRPTLVPVSGRVTLDGKPLELVLKRD
jgi:ABC-type cobalamin transport system ATPase subunit